MINQEIPLNENACNRAWNFIDLSGQRFGRLLVLREYGKIHDNSHIYWVCVCDCGREKLVSGKHLRNGKIKSCGCLSKEVTGQLAKQRAAEGKAPGHRTHGFSKTRLYNTYTNMKTRCYNTRNKAFKWYGARGVTICDEWLSDFNSFKTWAENNGYSPELTIDRIDPFKGYSPDNCRWVTIQEQRKTTRRYVLDHGYNT